MTSEQNIQTVSAHVIDLMDIKEIHLFLTRYQLVQPKRSGFPLPQLQNLISRNIESSDDILEVYSYIRCLIQDAKKVDTKQEEEDDTNDDASTYYEKKSLLFHKFYNFQSANQEIKINKIFNITTLEKLFLKNADIRRYLKNQSHLLKNKIDKRGLRMNVLILIFWIQNLLKEIKNAAYPFSSIGNKEICLNKTYWTEDEWQILKKEEEFFDNKNRFFLDDFDEFNSNPLEQYLSQLNQQIQYQNSLQSTTQINKKEELQIIKGRYSLLSLLFRYSHKRIQQNQFLELKKGFQILESQKIRIDKDRNIQKIINVLKIFIEDFSKTIRREDKLNQQKEVSYKLVSLLQYLMKEIHPSKSIALFDTYRLALKIYSQFDGQYLQKTEQTIFNLTIDYQSEALREYLRQHQKQLDHIVSLEQQFTKDIVKSSNIVNTLISYQEKWSSLFLERLIRILEIKQSRSNPSNFVQKIIEDITVSTKSEEKRKIDFKRLKLQLLEEIEVECFHKYRPYLRQIKFINLLTSILNKQTVAGNMYKAIQQQYAQLSEIASYFSKKRICPYYELKSKIFLFISLFKMGYYNPTVKEDKDYVNLRIRIQNLYIGISSNFNDQFDLGRSNSKATRNLKEDQVYIIHQKQQNNQSSINLPQIDVDIKNLQIINRQNDFQQDQPTDQPIDGAKSLSSIENQLFILENSIQQLYQDKLSQSYTEHLKKCVEKGYSDDGYLNLLLKFQRLLFLGKPIRAWNQLIQQIDQNNEFKNFLERFDCSNPEREKFKLARLYQRLQINTKNHIYFLSSYSTEEAIRILHDIVNEGITNPDNKIAQTVVKSIHKKKTRQKQFEELKRYREMRADNISRQSQSSYKPIEFENFKINQVSVKYKEKVNKIIFKITIGKHYRNYFKQLNQIFRSYELLNQIGIYKISDIQTTQQNQVIYIQSNPFFPEKQQDDLLQSFCKKILQTTVQAMSIFHRYIKNDLQLLQVQVKKGDYLSFCVNPFLGIIKGLLIQNSSKNLPLPLNVKNQAKIQLLMEPFIPEVSKELFWNYQFFLSQLMNVTQESDASKLLKLPIFMTLFEKQSQIIYFQGIIHSMTQTDQKKDQRDIRWKTKKSQKQRHIEANQYRLNVLMKNGQYRKFCYLFQVGGVIEQQLKALRMCKARKNGRIDWVTGHESVVQKISSRLQKYEDEQEFKLQTYSLTKWLKCLRDHLAHKSQDTLELIKFYEKQYSGFVSFLFQNKTALKISLEDNLQQKSNFFESYFDVEQQTLEKLKNIIDGSINLTIPIPRYTKQAIRILSDHREIFLKIKQSALNRQYKCKTCKYFIRVVKSSEDYIYFLKNVSDIIRQQHEQTGVNNYLALQHTAKPSICFLDAQLKGHLTMEIFSYCEGEVKHFLIKNWWFYLEYKFPCLIKSLQKIRYLLQI